MREHTAPEQITRTAVAGPVTLLLSGGNAHATGMASIPLEGRFALALPCHHPAVTALPGADAREVLRLALEDAILTAQRCADEQRERAYLRLLHALEDALEDSLP